MPLLEERDLKGELLKQIQQAEEEAASRIAEAESEAEKIRKDARRRAQQILEEGKQQADEAAQAAIESLRAELDAAEEKTVATGREDAERLRGRFEDQQEGVADRVVELWEERFA